MSRKLISRQRYIGFYVPGDVRVALEQAAAQAESSLSDVARGVFREWTNRRVSRGAMAEEQQPQEAT